MMNWILHPSRGGALLLALGALSACATDTTLDREDIAAGSFALTAADTLGFEDPAVDWTASSGTIEVETTKRARGAKSLGIRSVSYTTLTSRQLSTLSGVTENLALEVYVPSGLTWGTLSLQAHSPTAGLYSQWLGSVNLTGLTANTFNTVYFTLTSGVVSALQSTYSDLTFTITLQGPSTSSPYFIDNLHFESCASSTYSLDFSAEASLDPAFEKKMKCTFFTVYPQLAARFNTSAPTTVGMHFVLADPYPAWTLGDDVYYSIPYMTPHPNGTDVVVHEIMHVVQQGYVGSVPGWIIEGTADFVRKEYGIRNEAHGWTSPSGYSPGQHYRQGYAEAGAFFKWVDQNYRVSLPPIVDALDDAFRVSAYSPSLWVTLTGYDVDTLWYEYSGHDAHLPGTTGVRVYADSNYGGEYSYLDYGSYDVTELARWGVVNDWISSIRIPAGYSVTVYEHGSFNGAQATFTSDTPYVGDAWNDQISSIVVH